VSPTKWQCGVAFRKLYNHIEKSVNSVEISNCGTIQIPNHLTFTSTLPLEVLDKIAAHLNASELVSLQRTCWSCYQMGDKPAFWGSLTVALLRDIDMVDRFPLKPNANSKRGFIALHKIYPSALEVCNLLNLLQTTPSSTRSREQMDNARKQVEEIFKTKFGIPLAWKTLVGPQKLAQDLTELEHRRPPGVFVVVSSDRIALEVTMSLHEGFYAGEHLKFSINVAHYPQRPPTVRSLTQVYHPFINEVSKNVCLDIISEETWLRARYAIADVIQHLYNLFTDAKYITENFTL